VTTVLIPSENEKDLVEIPANVKKGLDIIPVGQVEEVLRRALVRPLVAIEWEEDDQPSAITDKDTAKEPTGPTTH
jgi:ATP-dependent Lon protease